MSHSIDSGNKSKLLLSAGEYFSEMVTSAFEHRKMEVKPMVHKYLTNLLEFYLVSENLFDSEKSEGRTETLAEKLLKAVNSNKSQKQELLKKLGDTTLYVSGFFGDSFKRKIIDIDYYVEIGGCAYGSLAVSDSNSIYSAIYGELANKFGDYVDCLTYISQKALIQNNEDLLRLYDRYIITGSKLAAEQLDEKGMLHSSLKKYHQN